MEGGSGEDGGILCPKGRVRNKQVLCKIQQTHFSRLWSTDFLVIFMFCYYGKNDTSDFIDTVLTVLFIVCFIMQNQIFFSNYSSQTFFVSASIFNILLCYF